MGDLSCPRGSPGLLLGKDDTYSYDTYSSYDTYIEGGFFFGGGWGVMCIYSKALN